jgi:hypothetical protein
VPYLTDVAGHDTIHDTERAMRQLLIALLLTAAVWETSAQVAQQSIDNAIAFARLYGVVRYFYPSDAAASLDWNRFAIHGVNQVRGARNGKELQATLQRLFNPLGPGIEISRNLPSAPALGDLDHQLIAWRYLGAAMADSSVPGPYRAKRTRRALVATAGSDGFATVMQTIPAQNLRGKTIRLRGLVRATSRESTAGAAALWLRVDRPNQQMGFFDNMSNRPIHDPDWKEYSIEGPVAEDATGVAFGVMASGTVTADFEAISLAVAQADGSWTPTAIEDGGFEATDAGSGGWVRAGTSKNVAITRPTDRAPEGRQFLRMSPMSNPASGAPSLNELFDSPPRTGARVDIDLGHGLEARVPTALSDTQAVEDAKRSTSLAALRAALARVTDSGDSPDLDTRLADVIVAWNVLRHFYPYWPESGVDWDARLRPQLALAYDATTRAAHRDTMRLVVTDARDGHGNVVDTRSSTAQRGWLPVRLGLIEGQLVVTATAAPGEAPVGAVLSTIDGVPAPQRLAEAMRLVSGTTQWKQTRALQEIAACATGTVVKVTIEIEAKAARPTSSLSCEAKPAPAEKRPEAITEVKPGLWYVDLTRARMIQITPVLDKLAAATGVIFDLRGYPTDAGAQILPHLIAAPETDRWMHVNKIIGPYGESAGWESFGWNLKPQSPRVGGKIVFLTDGRAISYAESVLGYVADRKLATIVGSATAGTNGNVAAFVVPGGFRILFTGMRVTGHDGRTPHHLVGVKPDVPMAPTVAGLRNGRDEVLDGAVALIGGQ